MLSAKTPARKDPEMSALLQSAATRAMHYLDGLGDRGVAPTPEAVAALASFEEPMPARPSDPAETLELLDRIGSPATMAMAGSRFFGFVIGGALPVSLATNWLAGAWDQNSALDNVTPATSRVEHVALRWIVELLGLPTGCGGAFVTGATVANFTALAAARHVVLKQAGWNVEADGLFGAPPINVVVGEEVHPSLIKSLGMLGLGRARVLRVPADAQGRMRADAIPRVHGPTIVCAQIGNVNTGAFDPLGEIAERIGGSGAWLHVDGAFGLWAAAEPTLRSMTEGLALADSWATDAHKWLNVPYDCGIALVRDPDALRAAMAITAEYLPTQTTQRNPADFTPELSRRARGVEVWAVLRSLGRDGLAELIERNCRQARRFAEAFVAAGHEVLNEVVLNQVLVSFGDAAMTQRVVASVHSDGTCWCGGTVWQGRTAMRISVSSWATTDDDVERSIAAILRAADSCRR
jgi:glutamate/tyrosine decarboxylase-like PLP-dependent enzyme